LSSSASETKKPKNVMHITDRDADESILRDSQREDSVLLIAKQGDEQPRQRWL
jgi:hypothetical protein